MEFLREEQSVWQYLREEKRPIFLYGMGDGADKILRVFADKGIRAAAVFASDEFVRGHSFAGFRVQKLSEVVAAYGEDIVIASAPSCSRGFMSWTRGSRWSRLMCRWRAGACLTWTTSGRMRTTCSAHTAGWQMRSRGRCLRTS